MIIKTNGFKMPNGDIHTFIPPSPTENERGGIKAKAKTTEALEVAFDEASERLYAAIPNTDKTLSETGVAADAKTTGDKIKDKLDRNQGIEHYGESLIVGEDGIVIPGEIQSGDDLAIVNTESGDLLSLNDSSDRKNKGFRMTGNTAQKSTRGVNLFDVSKVVPNNNVIRNGDGSMKVIADESNNGFAANTPNTLKDYCPLLIVGQTYTLSANTAATTKQIYLKESGTVWTYGKSAQITKEMLDSVVLFYSDINKTSIISNIQIEKGSTVTTYEPYTGGKPSPSPEYQQEIKNSGKWNEGTQKYEVDVKVTGKNLFDSEKAKDVSKWTPCAFNANFVEIAVYVGTGSTVTVSNNTKINNPVYYYGVALKSSEDIKYSICYPGYPSSKDTHTFTATEDYIYVRCNKTSLNDVIGVCGGLQIEIGASRTDFESYKEQTLTLTSDRPITKWDRLVEQGGQIGWLYRSEIITLTGDEHYVAYSDFNSFYTSIPALNRNGNTPFCNKYVHKSIVSGNLDKVFSVGDGSYDKVWFRDMRFNLSISDFKSYLQDEYSKGTPVEVVCTTKETEFVPLPQSEQNAIRALKTYYPTTTITNDQGCTMELDYVADTKNYIDNKFAQLQKSLINTNTQLL